MEDPQVHAVRIHRVIKLDLGNNEEEADSLEKAGPEDTKTLVLEINAYWNTFISTSASFTNQVLTLESKSEDFLEYIQVERQRNDSVESELINLDETVQKAQPATKRNTG